MDVLRDTRRKHHPSMEVDLRALVEVMEVYKRSCLIMDEVDLLLHPLRSELNFPIGKKHALDVSPQRWLCAIHCCDAVFYVERRPLASQPLPLTSDLLPPSPCLSPLSPDL